ncbi:hypothetical protein Y1Q_0009324 [Alligator mississippiensis]|uniref:Uncharacterized protein n=1 Tax=Alligator mississippiensis TaxID=8496 RepID=A0A151N7B0_ALLMI|nr:hypothetical protein Y1Q_0009324 [Alligator mississippiensis]
MQQPDGRLERANLHLQSAFNFHQYLEKLGIFHGRGKKHKFSRTTSQLYLCLAAVTVMHSPEVLGSLLRRWEANSASCILQVGLKGHVRPRAAFCLKSAVFKVSDVT